MDKKEYYRNNLPHFQQPGQAYFVTWCLKDSVHPKALARYTAELQALKNKLVEAKNKNAEDLVIKNILSKYNQLRRKYIKAFDDLLDTQIQPNINLSKTEICEAIKETLYFFQGKRIDNFAFCIMPNHIHWVFRTYENDESGNPVYLQDIIQSVKRFSANQINRIENRKGSVWQKESFETTIRNNKHLQNTIEYTIHNPVKANLVENPVEWSGNWWFD